MERARNGERRLALVFTGPEQAGPEQAGPEQAGPEREEAKQSHQGRPTREQFEYLSDMIRQMQVLAWHTGASALASILELAHREADEQRRALAPARRPWEQV